MINTTDINKFSFAQAMSNNNGKTSGSKFGSFIALITGCLVMDMAGIACIAKNPNGLALAGIAAGVISASLAGFAYSKNKETKDTTNTIEN